MSRDLNQTENLENENIIEKNEEKYYLKNLCIEELFLKNTRIDMDEENIDKLKIGIRFEKFVLPILLEKGHGVSFLTLLDFQEANSSFPRNQEEMKKELDKMISYELLARYTIDMSELYYFPMLGMR